MVKHRLLNLLLRGATAAALLTAAVFAGLWIRSHIAEDQVVYTWAGRGDESFWVTSGSGGVTLGRVQLSPGGADGGWQYARRPPQPPVIPVRGVLGFYRWDAATSGFLYSTRSSWIRIPYWAPTLVSAFAATVLFRRLRRRLRRAPSGLCERCGYDLRASQQRCPECGTSFTRPAQDPARPIT